MHLTPGLMLRISSSSARSSSTVLSGFVMTTPNDRTRSRCRVSACPAEYSIGKSSAESASPISRLTCASLPTTRIRLMFQLRDDEFLIDRCLSPLGRRTFSVSSSRPRDGTYTTVPLRGRSPAFGYGHLGNPTPPSRACCMNELGAMSSQRLCSASTSLKDWDNAEFVHVRRRRGNGDCSRSISQGIGDANRVDPMNCGLDELGKCP